MASLHVRDHQGKSVYLTGRLLEHGHTLANHIDECDILLVCNEWSSSVAGDIRAVKERGGKVVNYGHGFPVGGPPDREPNPLCDARFVPSQAYADYLNGWGFPFRSLVCGWPFSERRPFRVQPGPLVFGPIHSHEGRRRERDVCRNRLVRESLPVDVQVMDGGPRAIAEAAARLEGAGMVVATGTLAHLAVALGLPTLVYDDEWFPFQYPHIWPHATIGDALAEPVEWRAKAVGGEFDPSCLDAL